MRKLTDKQMGRIMLVLNKGWGDSWNNNYGIFRPMKDWNKLEWLQYGVIAITAIFGVMKMTELANGVALTASDYKEGIEDILTEAKASVTKTLGKLTRRRVEVNVYEKGENPELEKKFEEVFG